VLLAGVALVAALLSTPVLAADVVPSEEVLQVADEYGLDPVDLFGAVLTTNLSPRTYLCHTGEGACPKPVYVGNPRTDCIIWHESKNTPTAVNPRSKAKGLGQFLDSTWLTTPQGRAGYSVFDPVANRAAVDYMLADGRAKEFEVVTRGLC
jgi:hypothetical protein